MRVPQQHKMVTIQFIDLPSKEQNTYILLRPKAAMLFLYTTKVVKLPILICLSFTLDLLLFFVRYFTQSFIILF